MMSENDPNDYIRKIDKKINFHRQQSVNSKNWFNFFNLFTVVLASLQTFFMVILPLIGGSVLEITLTSSIFSLFIVICNKIMSNYEFLSLHYQHKHICDEFTVLHFEFLNMDLEDGCDMIKNIHIYSHLLTKSNIQNVADYRSIFGCVKKPDDVDV